MILDPYFDESGVEMVARMESANFEYVVVTNTQSSKEPEVRANSLKEKSQLLEILLHHLNFTLLDLQKIGKHERLFHDRYILMFDQNNQIQEGYHLSNSIQSATKNHPLLVTPVPYDLFDDIQAYLYDLLDASKENQIIETLFPSQKEQKRNKLFIRKPLLERMPEPGYFFSVLLQQETLISLSVEELERELKEKNILVENSVSSGSVKTYLNNVTEHLKNIEPEKFRQVWVALCELLEYAKISDQDIDAVFDATDKQFAKKIKTFLADTDKKSPPFGTFGIKINTETTGVLYLLRKIDLGEILREAGYYFDHPLRGYYGYYGIPSITRGIRFLVKNNPYELLDLFSEKVKFLFASGKYDLDPEIQSAGVFFDCILIEIIEIIEELSIKNKNTVEMLLNNNVPLCRAIGIQSLLFLPEDQTVWNFEDVITLLNELDRYERLFALGEWGFKLRVSANQRGFKETDELKKLRLDIFEQIKICWPEQIAQQDFRRITSWLSGPVEGVWASSTTNDLFIPMMNINKLKFSQISELWFSILFEHLQRLFSPYADISLTETCAWALAYSPLEEFIALMEKIEVIIQKNKSILEKPFSRSIDYSAWDVSRNGLIWIQTLLKLAKSYIFIDPECISDYKIIDRKIEDIEDILIPYNSERMSQEELHQFSLGADKNLEEKSGR
ncbi:MAG: hypothetical protein GY795_36195 [Desulfobacterales bacterium]|nr:hypothetical protein [Desulfobacterales bacterium]